MVCISFLFARLLHQIIIKMHKIYHPHGQCGWYTLGTKEIKHVVGITPKRKDLMITLPI